MKNLTFIQKEDLENYEEIDSYLNDIGYQFSHNYKNIPFYSKYTICKSIGDLINLYSIDYLVRLNKIPYRKKEYIEVDEEIRLIKNYKQYSYVYCNKELKRLKSLYNKTLDPIYISKQNEICIKKAQVDYLRANHNFVNTKQYYMLPEAAITYQNTILRLALSGEQLSITGNSELSTSSYIICINYYIYVVRRGYGRVDWTRKRLLLNTTGWMLEWVNTRLKPCDKYKLNIINKPKPDDRNWASIKDYCNYIDNYLFKLSKITGDKYPKCSYIINSLNQVQFKVPSFVLTFY